MTAMTAEGVAAAAALTVDERRRRAIRGAFWSEFIDMFDVYLPVVVLAPVLPYFQPPQTSSGTAVLLSSLVFVMTLLGRPVGAVLFGLVADRLGRRRCSVYAISGFGVVTLLIALLPDYAQLGMVSYVLLVLLRFADGIFLGGGYTGAVPLALEYAQKSRRGFVGALIPAAFCAAYLGISLITMLMFVAAPLQGPHSAYARWGWRVPFVIGALLAGVLALYYAHRVAESQVWQSEVRGGRERLPLAQLLGRRGRGSVLQVMVMMTGFWLTQNLVTIYLPTGLLRQDLHLTGLQVTSILLLAYALMFFSYLGAGLLSQRLGRRRFFVVAGTLIATAGAALLYWLTGREGLPMPLTVVLVCAMAVLVTSPWGAVLTYLNERFATEVRATGFGIGVSLSLVIPSFYAFYMSWLGHVVPPRWPSVLLLLIGAVLGVVGALLGPETRDVDF